MGARLVPRMGSVASAAARTSDRRGLTDLGRAECQLCSALSLQGVLQVLKIDAADHKLIKVLALQTTSGLVNLAPQAKASFYSASSRVLRQILAMDHTLPWRHLDFPSRYWSDSGLASWPAWVTQAMQTSSVVARIVPVAGREPAGNFACGANTGLPRRPSQADRRILTSQGASPDLARTCSQC